MRVKGWNRVRWWAMPRALRRVLVRKTVTPEEYFCSLVRWCEERNERLKEALTKTLYPEQAA